MSETVATPKLEEPKKELLSPEREKLEVRLKEVEVDTKLQELSYSKLADDLNIEKMKIEVEEAKRRGTGWLSPIDQLLSVARAWCIDNSRTVIGSEPALKSLWEDDELEEIKHLIMKKARKL